jgi:hypothetical protein
MSDSTSSSRSSLSTAPTSPTLESPRDLSSSDYNPLFDTSPRCELTNLPNLVAIVRRACLYFGCTTATISILKGDQQIFLASEGLDFSVEQAGLPRAATFCEHTVGEKGGLVVLDAKDDARLVRVLGRVRSRADGG